MSKLRMGTICSNHYCSQLLLGAGKRSICSMNYTDFLMTRSMQIHDTQVRVLSTKSKPRKRRSLLKPKYYDNPPKPEPDIASPSSLSYNHRIQRSIKLLHPDKVDASHNIRDSFNSRAPRSTEMNDEFIIKNAARFSVRGKESRLLETLIRKDPDSVGRQVLQNILPQAMELAKHPIGSFVIRACLEIEQDSDSSSSFQDVNGDGLSQLQAMAASKAIELALNKLGSHFLSECLDKGTEGQREAIINQLIHPTGENLIYVGKTLGKNGHRVSAHSLFVMLACNECASHVLQKAVLKGSQEHVSFIQASAAPRAIELALNKFGVYFLGECLEKGSEEQKTAIVNQLIHPTEDNLIYLEKGIKPRRGSEMQALAVLSCDVYGNHVVQRALQKVTREQRDEMFDFLVPNLVELSKHAHGTYVLQAALREITRRRLKRITDQVLKPTGKNCIPLPPNTNLALHLAKNVNGFHVVKSIVDESLGPDKELLLNQIPVSQEPLRQALLGKVHLNDIYGSNSRDEV